MLNSSAGPTALAVCYAAYRYAITPTRAARIPPAGASMSLAPALLVAVAPGPVPWFVTAPVGPEPPPQNRLHAVLTTSGQVDVGHTVL